MRGDVTFSSEAHVYGIIDGDLVQQSNHLLHIGKTGWTHGSVRSQGPVVIEGRVDGEIQAAHKIVILSTATVRGRLTAPKIQIKAGAIVEGDVQMGAPLAPSTLVRAA